MARLVVTKIIQRIDNVNADLVTDDDYVIKAEANITLGAAGGDIIATKLVGSYLAGDSAALRPLALGESGIGA